MDRQMNIALRKTLDQIGVKHSLKGYGYIISAVEKCLENRSNLINKIFGYTVSVEKGKPTNSEFIALITDFVSLYGDEIANGSYKW